MSRRRNRIPVQCHSCDKPIEIIPSRLKAGRGKFCSRRCYKKETLSTRASLTIQAVCDIRENYKRYVNTRISFARKYGVTRSSVDKVISGVTWNFNQGFREN